MNNERNSGHLGLKCPPIGEYGRGVLGGRDKNEQFVWVTSQALRIGSMSFSVTQ